MISAVKIASVRRICFHVKLRIGSGKLHVCDELSRARSTPPTIDAERAAT